MSGILSISPELAMPQDEKHIFKMDVLTGLSNSRKTLPSKYFYDAKGCELFNQITRHPDYYLTDCEIEILTTHRPKIAELFDNELINLIELGPGEGIKTNLLLEQFQQHQLNFTYTPIDIAEDYLLKLSQKISQQFPQLNINPIQSDYLAGLTWLTEHSTQRKFVLFLGSSIGNFDLLASKKFLRDLWHTLNPDDYVLIGFDLRKDIDVLMRAYNDSDGVTRDFNLNLLHRINRELSANFVIDKFFHYEIYNVYSGAMESYLISGEQQTVTINALNQTFNFHAFEAIHVEYSYKYLKSQIQDLAHDSGFEIIQNFTDSKQYFVDSLWKVV